MKKHDFDSAVDVIEAYIDSDTQIDPNDITSVNIDITNQKFTLKFSKVPDIEHTFCEAGCTKENCKSCIYADECDTKNELIENMELMEEQKRLIKNDAALRKKGENSILINEIDESLEFLGEYFVSSPQPYMVQIYEDKNKVIYRLENTEL